MKPNTLLKVKLSALNFLEFAVWGAYLTSLGNYLGSYGLASDIKWFYAIQGIVSMFMPAIIGIVADKWIQAQKMLSICQMVAGLFMLLAGWYGQNAGIGLEFWPLFALYTTSVAFYMPTIGLTNSVAYSALNGAGMDTVKDFPPIRVFGTVGFICSMLFVNFTQFQSTYMQLFTSGVLSFVLAAYALTMPACAVNKNKGGSMIDALGLRAFSLFKDYRMALFFIFSMLLGVSLQITNGYGNVFITSFGELPDFADLWGVRNANALISLSQLSETLCILLIPFALRKFGIKGVMLIAMVAWVLRFGFFGIGNPGDGIWLFILSMIVYGVAFDFFNVSGSLYVDQQTDPTMRSSAQGLFMIMTNGLGATLGTLAAGAVLDHFVFTKPLGLPQVQGWHISWLIFAAYALVVAILFLFMFHPAKNTSATTDRQIEKASDSSTDPAGFVED